MADTNIESLSLQISSDASSAISGIEALSKSLLTLKSATSGGFGNLSSLAKQMQSLSTSANSISSSSVNGISNLAITLQRLKNVGDIKLSSSLGNQLKSIAEAGKVLNSMSFRGITELSQSLSVLSQASQGLGSFNTLIKSFEKLNTTVPKLRGSIGPLGQEIQRLVKAINPLTQELERLAAAFNSIPTTARSASSAMDGVKTAAKNMEQYSKKAEDVTKVNNVASKSFASLAAKVTIVVASFRKALNSIAKFVNESNSYVENLNLFTVSMGKYAEEAKRYAEYVGDKLGIDPSEWMRAQGTMNSIIKGFGVAGDKAAMMSQQLTQLSYDLSSLFNTDIETAMTKVQAGITGQLKPLREFGYDLSIARLQEEALALGIEKSVSEMNQAEKAQLRYVAIMKQVSWSHNDMARTINAPANQLRVLKAQLIQAGRAIGDIFIPALNAILPVAIAVVKVIRMIANALSSLMGFSLPEMNWDMLQTDGIGGLADDADDAASGLGNAAKKAKELKNALLGIDELNVIEPPKDDTSGGAGGIGGIGGSDLGINLDDYSYDFLDGLDERLNDIAERMREWLEIDKIKDWASFWESRLGRILSLVCEIGAAFATWKIGTGIVNLINALSGLGGTSLFGSMGTLGLLLTFAIEMKRVVGFFKDITENGATFDNVVGLIASFSSGLGIALATLGATKFGGALLAIGGIADIVRAVKDISDGTADFDTAIKATYGISELLLAIGVVTKNAKFLGGGMALMGITTVVTELKNNWEAIKSGDWSGVDKVNLAIGAVQSLAGFIMAFNALGKLKGLTNSKMATSVLKGVPKIASSISTAISSIGVGALILPVAEIFVGGGMFFGGIWDAIKNGIDWLNGIIMTAGGSLLGLGIGGLVAAFTSIGSIAGPVGAAIGAVVGILSAGVIAIIQNWDKIKELVGVAIEWIKEKFDKIKSIVIEKFDAIVSFMSNLPENIGNIITAIQDWFLGLPERIGYALGFALGTIVKWGIDIFDFLSTKIPEIINAVRDWFMELPGKIADAIATTIVKFAEWVVGIYDYLSVKVPEIIDSVKNWFITLPDKIKDAIASAYDKFVEWANGIFNFLSKEIPRIVSSVVEWFSELPGKIYDLGLDIVNGLINGVQDAWRSLKKGVTDFCSGFVNGFKDALGIHSPSTEMAVLGGYLAQGLNVGVEGSAKSTQATLQSYAKNIVKWFFGDGYLVREFKKDGTEIVNAFNSGFNSSSGTTQPLLTTWAKNINTWFKSDVNEEVFKKYAMTIINAFKDTINNRYGDSRAAMSKWGSENVKAFQGSMGASQFEGFARNVIDGFNRGINNYYYTTLSYMRRWAQAAADAYKSELEIASPSKLFTEYGAFTVEGYNKGILENMNSTSSVMSEWSNGISSSFAIDTSNLDYYTGKNFSKSLSTEVQGSYEASLSTGSMVDALNTFYNQTVAPTMNAMSEDMRRQADKQETTYVQVGNKVITDSVNAQQRANGYRFVRG